MVPARKQQEEEEIPENVKTSGSETCILKWNTECPRKGFLSAKSAAHTVAEQSPLSTLTLQNAGYFYFNNWPLVSCSCLAEDCTLPD